MPKPNERDPELTLLLSLLDQAYDRKAWHGPNLKGSIRRLTAPQATWRPRPGRHCIAEIVLHAAYWKYAVRRRLLGEKRGSFALKGSNWFPVAETLDDAEWREHTRLLDSEHRALRAAALAFDPRRLHTTTPGSHYTPADHLQGIAAHDIYHAGQIQLLKRLQEK